VAAFLFKTEPSTYSFDDLAREKKTVWDGSRMRSPWSTSAAITVHTE
jgi:predicted RNA-binding protein with PUA-like domain